MGVLEIFYWYPGDIWWVSWWYFFGALEIFYRCHGHIWWVSWTYL